MTQFALVMRGFMMGLADLVPGVSGGTLALILGIYNRFITALSRIDRSFFALVARGKLAHAWTHADGGFLLSLFVGIASSFILFSHAIDWALVHYPSALFASFFGLVLASLPWLYAQVSLWGVSRYLGFAAGVMVGVLVSIAVPLNMSWPVWCLLPAGFIAISAMLLPGVSGSFLLLLFGFYGVFIEALKTLDLIALSYFGMGAALGFLVFPKWIHALLRRAYDTTLACLIGLVTGALVKLWPWHQSAELAWPALWPDEASIVSVALVFACMAVGLLVGVVLTVFTREESHGH